MGKIMYFTDQNKENELCQEAEKFIFTLLELYIKRKDFAAIKSFLLPNITWQSFYSSNLLEGCLEVITCLEKERYLIGSISYEKCKIQAKKIHSELILIYVTGNFKMAEGTKQEMSAFQSFQITLFCCLDQSNFHIMHAHCSSSPYATPSQQTFYLEKLLQERTKQLTEKSLELETLTNNICGGVQICRLDEHFSFLYISNGFEKMIGYKKEELISMGYHHTCLVYPPDLHIIREGISTSLRVGEHFSMEYRMLRKDGKLIWVLDKGVRLKDDAAGSRVQCTLLDITTQKEQEEALRFSERRYEIALNSSDVTIFEYNIVTKELIFFNNTADMYNLPNIVQDGPETLISRGTIEALSVPGYRKMYRKIHAGEPQASCLITTKDASGMFHDFELTLTTIYDIDQNPVRAVGIRKNVTQMVRLQKEQEFGKTLVANRTFICESNLTSSKITDVNPTWLEKTPLQMKSYTVPELVNFACANLIAPEYEEVLRKHTSFDYLSQKFRQGEKLVSFTYKSKNTEGNYIWNEATINIIQDERFDDLYARFYEENIHEKKIKEQKAVEEKRRYDSMITKAVLAYEINITRNLAVHGHEKWDGIYDIQLTNDYSQMIEAFAQKAIHLEDRETFLETFRRETLLKNFYNGQQQIFCHYKKLAPDGKYKWNCCTLYSYEDPETGHVRGFSYVEDIDKQKRKELELKFNAEHDGMTKFYNKITTVEKIQEFLKTESAKKKMHAFFMIDIDHFKLINDYYGHAFGDAVLCDLSDRLRKIFREEDILGRVGGDEFCIFMKNVPALSLVNKKAQEICTKLKQNYDQDGITCEISASVGIVLYPYGGKNYEALYKQADNALYQAKKNGRNGYVIMEP